MTPAEAATVLAVAAAFDNRTVGDADAQAWAAVLSDISPDEAVAAVARHYRDSRDWLMPVDVRRIALAQRRETRLSAPQPVPPRELADEPQREAQWFREYYSAIQRGHDEAQARAYACSWLEVEDDPQDALQRPTAAVIETLRKQLTTTEEKP